MTKKKKKKRTRGITLSRLLDEVALLHPCLPARKEDRQSVANGNQGILRQSRLIEGLVFGRRDRLRRLSESQQGRQHLRNRGQVRSRPHQSRRHPNTNTQRLPSRHRLRSLSTLCQTSAESHGHTQHTIPRRRPAAPPARPHIPLTLPLPLLLQPHLLLPRHSLLPNQNQAGHTLCLTALLLPARTSRRPRHPMRSSPSSRHM